jgi:hypothetical protein
MYSHTNQKDSHYYCKLNGTRARKRDPESVCPTPYIRATVIEPKIETLLSMRLQDDGFLAGITEAYLEQQSQQPPIGISDRAAVQRQIEHLTAKRSRILEAFFDGTIDRRQRDEQLSKVDAELKAYQVAATAMLTTIRPTVTMGELVDLFSAFAEMPFLSRDDKRALLRGLGVEVFVSGYKIHKLAMRNVAGSGCNTDNRPKTAPSVLPVLPCR